MSETPVFDSEKALRQTGHDIELFGEVVEMLLESTPSQLDGIGDAIAKADAHLLEQRAHLLKGAISSLGGEEASALALQLELLGMSGSTDGAGDLLQTLRGAFDRLTHALREYLEQNAPAQ